MSSDKKILGVITARGGSKGIPKKNIKLLAGRPLIAYTISVAKKSSMIDDLIVSTDDKKIAEICRQYQVKVPFLRPAELAGDTVGHLEVIKHAIKSMEEQEKIKYDYVVIFQPTSPFRLVEDIDQTIEKIIKYQADSAFSMCEVSSGHHPIKAKMMEGDLVLPYLMEEEIGTRRQDFPPAYKRSGSVYVTRRDLPMEENRLFGDKIVGHLIDNDRSIDIDTYEDWLLAKYKYAQLKKQGFFEDYFNEL